MSPAKTAAKKPAKTTNKMRSDDAMNKPKESAFDSLGDMLGTGVDALFANDGAAGAFEIMVSLDEIEIEAQVREEFEDDENSLADLGKSLRKRQLQAIVLRPNQPGRPKPYLLVAGERRVRGALLEGLTELRARVEDMSDEEAEDAQLAENIHRKNLTQIEEARKIQRDLDQLGSVEAVLEKHQKSRAWLSKILALLHLPEQAKRLVSENVSADLEVINTVKTIEKADPEAAKALVDDLKATRGKANAREKVASVKDAVKPSKKSAKGGDGGAVATPKDRSAEEPGPVSVFAGAKTDDADPFADAGGGNGQTEQREPAGEVPALPPTAVLHNAYTNIFEHGSNPKMVLDTMAAADRDSVEAWLGSFYEAGVSAPDLGRAVVQGFRNGKFSTDGEGAFALVAFLQGADSEAKFGLLDILGSVKA